MEGSAGIGVGALGSRTMPLSSVREMLVCAMKAAAVSAASAYVVPEGMDRFEDGWGE